MDKNKTKSNIYDIVGIVVGTTVLALGIHIFTAPNNIAPGGVSGMSTIMHRLFGLPIGVVSLCINIPLLILSWFSIGKRYTLKTLLSVMTFSIMMDLVIKNVPEYFGDPMLASLFGGVLIGGGQAIVFLRDASTGGTDILGKFLHKRNPNLSLGNLMLLIDGLVVVISMFVFSSIEVSLYAIITIFVGSKLIDVIIYGADNGKLVYIVSSQTHLIANKIIDDLDRSATFLKGRGAFSGKDSDVLICAIRTSEFFSLKKCVHEIDPNAFMIVTDSTEIFGEGFKNIKE